MNTKSEAQNHCNHVNPPKRKPQQNLFYALVMFLFIFLVCGIIALYQISAKLPPAGSPSPMQFYITTLFSLLVLGAIIAQILVSERQWRAMQNAVRHSEQSMRISEATYITVQDIGFSSYQVGQPVHARIVVENVGHTPAYDFRIWAHLDYRTIPFRFTQEQAKDLSEMTHRGGHSGEIIGKREAHPSVMGPTDQNTQDITWLYLTNEMLVGEKAQPLHFWGLFTYTDIFGRDRWGEFCYVKVIDGETTSDQYALAMAPHHNDADRST